MTSPFFLALRSRHAPAAAAFFGSILLSLIALHFNPVLGRDSAFYLSLAEIYTAGGLSELTRRFDWPWLPLLVAELARWTGVALIPSGHLLMLLLQASLSLVLVRSAALLRPEAAWWGCLVALSLPAFNTYRDAILREPGFWLFTALTMQLFILWTQDRTFRALVGAVLCIALAMMFRLEAVFLLPALGCALCWLHRDHLLRRRRGVLLALLGGTALAVVLGFMGYALEGRSVRVTYYLTMLNPETLLSAFSQSADRLAEAVLAEYSQGDAELILLAGFAAVILLKTVMLCGPFVLIACRGRYTPGRQAYAPIGPMLIAAAGLYTLVLMVFFMQHSFMIDRYVALLHVLAAPALALAAQDVARKYKRLGWLLAAAALLVALVNVVSLSEKRTHYLDAANWIRSALSPQASIFFEDPRVGFYAGHGYDPAAMPGIPAGEALAALDYLVLDEGPDEPKVRALVEAGTAKVIAHFQNDGKRELSILELRRSTSEAPAASAPQP